MSNIKRILFILVTLLMVSSITGQRNRDENPNEEGNGKKSNSTPSLTECHQVKANLTCPDEKISFTLYNRAHLSDGIKINATSANLRSFFNLTAPVKLIVHGIILDILTPSLITMGFEYINKSDHNVIIVDYEYYAGFGCYIQSLNNLDHVGSCIGQLLSSIRTIGITDIHLITYSLGAHVANYVALSLAPYKIPRISGLDPPQIMMESRPESVKLDPSDAEFVDIYVTSAIGFGWGVNYGHAAFYFNGGIIQPGCVLGMCSHTRAVEYFSETIRSERKFYGQQCKSYWAYFNGNCEPNYVIAGEDCGKDTRGMYFVSTENSPPFAKGRPK